MRQFFNNCWQIVSCGFMLLMLYPLLLDICDPEERVVHKCNFDV